VAPAEGNILGAVRGLASRVPRGISPGHARAAGHPGTWENPEISAANPGRAPGDQKSRPMGEGVRTLWERSDGRTCGTAKRRKRSAAGRAQGVLAPQWYRGSGGTIPRDPVEGRGVSGHGTVGGKDDKVAEP
jgi:hypothetical protein